MPDTQQPFGFLNINKSPGMTSHDVVAKIRRGLKIKKVGHAGTLDPMATGVLVICLGYATRLSEYAMASGKRYRARVHLGETTDTYDAEGEILSRCDAGHIAMDDVERELVAFTGAIEQVPPMYSAIKQGGKKLYELARAGKTVERPPRQVTIESLQISEWENPYFTLDVICSSGTYIRSLAYDLGEVLGVGAHLAGLTRTASGKFTIENSVSLDDLFGVSDWKKYVLPPEFALDAFPQLQLNTIDSDHVRHGRSIGVSEVPEADLIRAYDEQNRLIALLKDDGNGGLRPHKGFPV